MKLGVFDVEPSAHHLLEERYRDDPNVECHVYTEPIGKVDAAHLTNLDAISIFIPSKVDAGLLAKMPALKLIACRSTGFDNVDMAAVSAREITVCNVPSYGENTVAEYAFAILLMLSRKLLPSMKQIEDGAINHNEIVGFDLSGKTLGVLGTGKIGKHSISIGQGFGMNIVGYDKFQDDSLKTLDGFRYVEFDELLAESDVITIHVPLTDDNAHMFNTEAFAKCAKRPVIINTSRGEIIDTKALVEALSSGQIAGAGLDVIEEENLLVTDDEITLLTNQAPVKSLSMIAEQKILTQMPNVVITPHNAFNTVEAVHRIWNTTLANIDAYRNGNPTNVVHTS